MLAVMIVVQLFIGWMFHEVIEGPARGTWFEWHKSLGVTILLMSLLRLAWRLLHRPPPLPTSMPAWQRIAAHLNHWAFYAVMIGLPLTGYAAVSTGRRALADGFVTILGGIRLPLLPLPSDAHHWFEESHEFLVTATFVLLALHVGAVLKHYFIDRDGVAGRMLPFLRRTG